MARTPDGMTPEKAINGNSGDPAKSSALPKKNARAVRNNKDTKATAGNTVQRTVNVPPSGSLIVDASSGKDSGIDEGISGAFSDGYRNSSNRIIDEGGNSVASISIEAGKDSIINMYSNFMLQAVSESEQEKYQVVETFTSYYAFFYGKRPPVYTYSGMLLNDTKSGWSVNFKEMYERYFRGTAAAELGAQAVIKYGKKSVTGFILNLNIQEDAMNPNGTPFSFSLLVMDFSITNFGSDFNAYLDKVKERVRKFKEAAKSKNAQIKNPKTGPALTAASFANGTAPAATVGAGTAENKSTSVNEVPGNGASSDRAKSNEERKNELVDKTT